MEGDHHELRYAISSLIVELQRSTPANSVLNLNERLVVNAIAISTFGPYRLNRQKISDVTSVPYATTGRALRKLMEMDRVMRLEDDTYVFTAEWQNVSYDKSEVVRRARAVLRAADAIAKAMEKPVVDASDRMTARKRSAS